MTRRVVVKAAACALVGLGSVPRFLVRAAHATPTKGKVLVAVFQRGAVDGLAMVPPHGDPGYAAVRPTTALERPSRSDSGRAIDLDGQFALHPALAPLVPLWHARSLAVVHACGSPDATRSHFDAQDYMETGTPGARTTPDGWLGRALGTLPPRSSPFRAVAIGPRVPRALRGATGAVAMASIADFELHASANGTRPAFEAVYTGAGREPLRGAGRETFEAIDMLWRSGASRLAVANGAQYPRGPFGESMRQIAQLIRADVGLEIAFADMGGFDTHAAQGAERGPLAARLTAFGAALAAFARDLGDRWNDVVVLTMSEFGRTVAENGAAGTDHGHGTAMLVLGGHVRGGTVYGRWPGLAREQRFEGRDLAVATDFRTLFAEVASGHLGIPASAAIFPDFTPETPLGLFA